MVSYSEINTEGRDITSFRVVISNAYLALSNLCRCLALFAGALNDATLLASPQELSKVLQARCSYVVRAEKKDEGK
jgi:hypothetical protein